MLMGRIGLRIQGCTVMTKRIPCAAIFDLRRRIMLRPWMASSRSVETMPGGEVALTRSSPTKPMHMKFDMKSLIAGLLLGAAAVLTIASFGISTSETPVE